MLGHCSDPYQGRAAQSVSRLGAPGWTKCGPLIRQHPLAWWFSPSWNVPGCLIAVKQVEYVPFSIVFRKLPAEFDSADTKRLGGRPL